MASPTRRRFESFAEQAGNFVRRNQGAEFDRTPRGDVLKPQQARVRQIVAPVPGLGAIIGLRTMDGKANLSAFGQPESLDVTHPVRLRFEGPVPGLGIKTVETHQEKSLVIDDPRQRRREDIRELGRADQELLDVSDPRQTRREGTMLAESVERMGQFRFPAHTSAGRAERAVDRMGESEIVNLLSIIVFFRNVTRKLSTLSSLNSEVSRNARSKPREEREKIITPAFIELSVRLSDMQKEMEEILTEPTEFVRGLPVRLFDMEVPAILKLQNLGVTLEIERFEGLDADRQPKVELVTFEAKNKERRTMSVLDGARTTIPQDIVTMEVAHEALLQMEAPPPGFLSAAWFEDIAKRIGGLPEGTVALAGSHSLGSLGVLQKAGEMARKFFGWFKGGASRAGKGQMRGPSGRFIGATGAAKKARRALTASPTSGRLLQTAISSGKVAGVLTVAALGTTGALAAFDFLLGVKEVAFPVGIAVGVSAGLALIIAVTALATGSTA